MSLISMAHLGSSRAPVSPSLRLQCCLPGLIPLPLSGLGGSLRGALLAGCRLRCPSTASLSQQRLLTPARRWSGSSSRTLVRMPRRSLTALTCLLQSSSCCAAAAMPREPTLRTACSASGVSSTATPRRTSSSSCRGHAASSSYRRRSSRERPRTSPLPPSRGTCPSSSRRCPQFLSARSRLACASSCMPFPGFGAARGLLTAFLVFVTASDSGYPTTQRLIRPHVGSLTSLPLCARLCRITTPALSFCRRRF